MATDTNSGKWDCWYAIVGDDPEPYADTPSYRLGADWLARCQLVEDWGCGKGWLRTLIPAGRYRGIDGSRSPFADVITDLADFRSDTPGLFMRHVLEHDFRWPRILDNALASFTDRMALILFTPLGEVTRDIEWEDPPGVPNLSFRLEDLTTRIDAADVTRRHETFSSSAKYGTETIFYLEKSCPS